MDITTFAELIATSEPTEELHVVAHPTPDPYDHIEIMWTDGNCHISRIISRQQVIAGRIDTALEVAIRARSELRKAKTAATRRANPFRPRIVERSPTEEVADQWGGPLDDMLE